MKDKTVTAGDVLSMLKQLHPEFSSDDVLAVERSVAFSRAFVSGKEPECSITATVADKPCACGSDEQPLTVYLWEKKTLARVPYLVCCGSCFTQQVAEIRQLCQVAGVCFPVKSFIEWSRLLHSVGLGVDYEPKSFTPERFEQLRGMFCLTLEDVGFFTRTFGSFVREG